jgi:hypothetical protein
MLEHLHTIIRAVLSYHMEGCKSRELFAMPALSDSMALADLCKQPVHACAVLEL